MYKNLFGLLRDTKILKKNNFFVNFTPEEVQNIFETATISWRKIAPKSPLVYTCDFYRDLLHYKICIGKRAKNQNCIKQNSSTTKSGSCTLRVMGCCLSQRAFTFKDVRAIIFPRSDFFNDYYCSQILVSGRLTKNGGGHHACFGDKTNSPRRVAELSLSVSSF